MSKWNKYKHMQYSGTILADYGMILILVCTLAVAVFFQ